MANRTILFALLGATFLVAPLFASAQTADPAAAAAVGAPPSGAALTRLEERLNSLEQQLRGLTGKIEEQQYAMSQLQKNQDNQLNDMSRRLQDLEVRINTVGASTIAVPGGASAPAAPTPAPVENKAAALAPSAAPTAITPPATTADGPGMPPVPPGVVAPPSDQGPIVPTQPGNLDGPLASAPTVKPLGSVSETGKAQAGTPEADYEAAFALIKSEKYAEAETAFRAFMKKYPNHDLNGNALYWIGESLYARKEYKTSAKTFAEGYQKYRTAPKAADNLLKLALSLQALGSTDDACVTYKQFKSEYTDAPTSLKARADAEMTKLECKS